jgi:hypothetical protein
MWRRLQGQSVLPGTGMTGYAVGFPLARVEFVGQVPARCSSSVYNSALAVLQLQANAANILAHA